MFNDIFGQLGAAYAWFGGNLGLALLLAAAALVIAFGIRQRRVTWQTRRLYRALRKRDVKAKLEYWDGHKHVDIYLPRSRLSIEVDGLQHYLDPVQMISDARRACASCGQHSLTLHIPNLVVEKYLKRLADTLAAAAKQHERRK